MGARTFYITKGMDSFDILSAKYKRINEIKQKVVDGLWSII